MWKRWTRELLPKQNQRLMLSKELVRKNELAWLVDDSVKSCEHKPERFIEFFIGNSGAVHSVAVKMVLHIPVAKLVVVFYEVDSEIENSAGDVGATSSHKKE